MLSQSQNAQKLDLAELFKLLKGNEELFVGEMSRLVQSQIEVGYSTRMS